MNLLFNLKCVRETYRENKVFFLVVCFALILVLGILFFGIKKTSAGSLFDDDFEAYSESNLSGQGDWTGTGSNTTITTENTFEGTKAVKKQAGGGDVKRLTTPQTDGVIGFYFNYTDNADAVVGLRVRNPAEQYCLNVGFSYVYCNAISNECGFWHNDGSDLLFYATTTQNVWHLGAFEWNATTNSYRIKIDDLEWSVWGKTHASFVMDGVDGFCFEEASNGLAYFDNIVSTLPPPPPEYPIEITDPIDGSTLDSAFTMTIDYTDLSAYERLMIIFEDWDASTTCPVYGDENWALEYTAYFNYQSQPYFSDYFTTSTGTTFVDVDNLPARDYRCVRCYAINETTGTTTEAICPDYNISVSAYIPPGGLPTWSFAIPNWTTYYASNTDKWATSTALFNSASTLLAPMVGWVGNLSLSFSSLFDASSSNAYGEQLGGSISQARGYLATIDNFFGGLPVSTIFLFYILTLLVIIILRLLSRIWHFAKFW